MSNSNILFFLCFIYDNIEAPYIYLSSQLFLLEYVLYDFSNGSLCGKLRFKIPQSASNQIEISEKIKSLYCFCLEVFGMLTKQILEVH